MSIFEIKCYAVECDKCKCSPENDCSDVIYFSIEEAEAELEDMDWIKRDGKIYCTECAMDIIDAEEVGQ